MNRITSLVFTGQSSTFARTLTRQTLALLSLLAGLALLVHPVQAGSYTNDFETGLNVGSVTATLYNQAARIAGSGNGGSVGLRLTETTNSTSGYCYLSDIDNGAAVQSFTMAFDLLIATTNVNQTGLNVMADGMSINFVQQIFNNPFNWGSGSGAERGVGLGLNILFDTHNADATFVGTNGIAVVWNGRVVGKTFMRFANNNAQAYVPCKITLSGGQVSLMLDGTNVFASPLTLPAFVPYPGRFIIAARTGGVNAIHRIDNLGIDTVTTTATDNTGLNVRCFRLDTGVGTSSILFNTTNDNVYRFPNNENAAVTWVNQAESPWRSADTNFATFDNYVMQMVGFIVPPTTGDYTFYVASDDQSFVYLSTDANPANKRAIAHEPSHANGFRNYTNAYSGPSTLLRLTNGMVTNISVPIRLNAKQAYYFEVNQVDGTGGDYCSVAWTGPGLPAVTNNGASISSAYLKRTVRPGLPLVAAAPAHTTGEVGGVASFSALADGEVPYTTWWLTNGVPVRRIPADVQTNQFTPLIRPLELGPLTAADSGLQVQVVISNRLGVVTSPAATLTVQDTVQPRLLAAVGDADPTQVRLIFSEPLDNTDGSATDPFSYAINGANPGSAVFGNGEQSVVILQAPNIVPGANQVSVQYVKDFSGKELDAAYASASFCQGVLGAPGQWRRERFDIGGGGAIATLTNHALYRNNTPNAVDYLTTSRAETIGDNYGARITGMIIPPVSGFYQFIFQADDGGSLSLSTDETRAKRQPMAYHDNYINALWVSSPYAVKYLQAGRPYYFEGYNKEGTGGDYLRTEWFGPHIAGQSRIYGSNLMHVVYPCDVGPTIVQHPTSVSVSEGQAATFTVVATSDGPRLEYQWRVNDFDIAGATNASFTFYPNNNDNGQVITCFVTSRINGGSLGDHTGQAIAGPATLTVSDDDTAPALVSVSPGTNRFDLIYVRFSERMDLVSLTTLGNYQASSSAGALNLTGLAAHADQQGVTLFTAPQAERTRFTVVVNGLVDAALPANPLAANSTASFTSWIMNQGYIRLELFTNTPSTGPSGDINFFVLQPKYLSNAPDVTLFLTNANFSSTTNLGYDLNNYGMRMSFVFVAPSNGHYGFYLNHDDGTRLLINTNGARSPLTQVINVNGTLNTFTSNDRAYTNYLAAGQVVYLEALVVEGSGGDYLRVGIKHTNDTTTLANLRPVAAQILFPTDPSIVVIPTLVEPQDITLVENKTVMLTYQVSGTPASYFSVLRQQWQRYDSGSSSFVNIPNATNATYSFTARYPADNGAQFRCLATVLTTNFTSRTATVTVQRDTSPPVVLSTASADGREVDICFDELLSPASATDEINYQVNAGQARVTNAILRADGMSVKLQLDTSFAAALTGTFTLEVRDMQDIAGTPNTGSSTATGMVANLIPRDIGTPGVDPLVPGETFMCMPTSAEISSSGTDLWNTTNGCHFLYKVVSGDFDVRARVAYLDPVNRWSKAGIMAAEDLSAGSRNVNLVADPLPVPTVDPADSPNAGANMFEANYRSVANGGSAQWPIGGRLSWVPVMPYPNAWIRLTRTNQTFVAHAGTNGIDWVAFGTNTVTPSYPNDLYVGFCVTAHYNTSLRALGKFFDLNFVQTVVPEPEIVNEAYNAGAGCTFEFASVNGVTYLVQYKNNLDDPEWSLLTTIVGNGANLTVVDAEPLPSKRFYRIKVQ